MPQERKLTEGQVRDIRSSTLSQARMAAKYGVDRKTVRNIRHGLTYSDVPDRPPVADGFHRTVHSNYLVGDPLGLLGRIPAGYVETVLTAPRPYRPVRVGDGEHRHHIRRQQDLIGECLRVVGAAGVVMYVHRPQFDEVGVADVGDGLFQAFPLRQVIVWNCPISYERRTEVQRPRGLRGPQNYANILVFAGEDWRVPGGRSQPASTMGHSVDFAPASSDQFATGVLYRRGQALHCSGSWAGPGSLCWNRDHGDGRQGCRSGLDHWRRGRRLLGTL